MLMRVRHSLRALRTYLELPPAARTERRADRRGLPVEDPGPAAVVREGCGWLARAQDMSASADGGVARNYSLVRGWNVSYPETTGYIVPTVLDCAADFGDPSLRERGRRMLDWLVSLQRADGGFPGGIVGEQPAVTVTFNTGQILIGLARGVQEFGHAYLEPMRGAADQLVTSQDEDGCWRKFPSPFANPGEKVYETHVAWGLYEAARVEPDAGRAERYAMAASRNVAWALTHQRPNGWFAHCCLFNPLAPLTHTLGYVLRGILEAHRYTGESHLLEAAERTARGILSAMRPDGFIPGRLDETWNGAVDYACLTGTAQIAHCWLMLYRATGEVAFRDAGFTANRFVRRTVRVRGSDDVRGGVKGSFPVTGIYGRYEYLNWACKFLVDACRLESAIRADEEDAPARHAIVECSVP